MNCIAFFCVFSVFLLSVEGAEKYPHSLTLKEDFSKVSWGYDENKAVFNFKVMIKTTGWAALALTTEKGAEDMKNYDIALGGLKTNSTNATDEYLYDYWSKEETTPTLDKTQSLTKESITESDGWTTLMYYRKADTGDSTQDVKIEKAKPIYFAWARGDQDIVSPTDFSKHPDKAGNGRGHTTKGYDLYTGKECCSAEKYPHSLTLKEDFSKVSWGYDENKAVFNFKVMIKTAGWAALALTAETGAADMKNYDIALGGLKTNSKNATTEYLYDYWSPKISKPTLDKEKSLTKESITESDGWTTLMYYRKADTKDSTQDVKIEKAKPIYFAWARGEKDIVSPTEFSKHPDKAGNGRGHTTKGYDLYTGKECCSGMSPLVPSAILVTITALLHGLA